MISGYLYCIFAFLFNDLAKHYRTRFPTPGGLPQCALHVKDHQ